MATTGGAGESESVRIEEEQRMNGRAEVTSFVKKERERET
jgi:hypothetical protein